MSSDKIKITISILLTGGSFGLLSNPAATDAFKNPRIVKEVVYVNDTEGGASIVQYPDPNEAFSSNNSTTVSSNNSTAPIPNQTTNTNAPPPPNPPGNIQQSIVTTALSMIGVSTANPATQGGNLGCAYGASLIFYNATGQYLVPGKKISVDTREVYDSLSRDPRWIRVPISEAQPGDCIITARKNLPGHVGFVVENGKIVSNSSDSGSIQQNLSLQSWARITRRNPQETAVFRYVGTQN